MQSDVVVITDKWVFRYTFEYNMVVEYLSGNSDIIFRTLSAWIISNIRTGDIGYYTGNGLLLIDGAEQSIYICSYRDIFTFTIHATVEYI